MNNRGQWKLAYTGESLIISDGLVYLGNKKPKGLYLDDVLEMIRARPDLSYYSRTRKRRVTLGEAIANGEFEALGQEREYHSSIDLVKLSPGRVFKELPKTGQDLLDNHYNSNPRRTQ